MAALLLLSRATTCHSVNSVAAAGDDADFVRVYGMASPPGGREVEFVSTPPPTAKPTDRFVLRAIKMFIDGAMGSRGAVLFEDYSDDPGNRGLILTEPELLEQITEAALKHGWQVCTHAIGDRGNRLVLVR